MDSVMCQFVDPVPRCGSCKFSRALSSRCQTPRPVEYSSGFRLDWRPMAQSGSLKIVWVLDRGDTMVACLLPPKQLSHEDHPSGPAVSSVTLSGVVENMMSDRHQNY